MKLLAPEMARLKELHKDDKMKLQQAMMALYKKEKVNPMSGCLPILVQIPVFFALYKVLFVTIEMRQMPFYGWIQDLSDRDPTSIFNLFGLIPWDPPSFLIIGAWPILWVLLCLFNKNLTQHHQILYKLKYLCSFHFFNCNSCTFSSWLVIYWTFNNILTMAQHILFIMKRTDY